MNNQDGAVIKDGQRKTWSYAADGWRRRDELLRKGAAPVTHRMLELCGVSSGHRLLDIASGTGEPAISAAHLVGSSGQVIGIDLVDDMLVVAREKAESADLKQIEFICMDGEAMVSLPGPFDAITIRWGLMFMPDPAACLKLAYQSLKRGGRIVIACWDEPNKNPFINTMVQTLSHYMELPSPPPGTPGIFAMANPDRIDELLSAAGFSEVLIESLEIDVMEVDDGQAYWEAVSDLAAPLMMLVNQLSDDQRKHYIAELIELADAMKTGDTLKMKGTTWIASALVA